MPWKKPNQSQISGFFHGMILFYPRATSETWPTSATGVGVLGHPEVGEDQRLIHRGDQRIDQRLVLLTPPLLAWEKVTLWPVSAWHGHFYVILRPRAWNIFRLLLIITAINLSVFFYFILPTFVLLWLPVCF